MSKQEKNRLKKGQSPFTTIYNELINDEELTLRDKGLYAFMMSKPNDWAFSIRGLAAQCIEGRDSIAKSLNRLIEKGWIKRYVHREIGKYKSYIYEILYTKEKRELSEISDKVSEKPSTEKRTISKNYNNKEREENFYKQNKAGINIYIDEVLKQEKENIRSQTGYKKELIHKFMKEDEATIALYGEWTIKRAIKQLLSNYRGKQYNRNINGVLKRYILEDIEKKNFEIAAILSSIEDEQRTILRVPFSNYSEIQDYLTTQVLTGDKR